MAEPLAASTGPMPLHVDSIINPCIHTRTRKVPVRWMAPESLTQRVFTHKSDVWSYGVTVWETLTFGARPYHGRQARDILRLVEGGLRLEQPLTCSTDLYGLLLECEWCVISCIACIADPPHHAHT